MSDTATNQDLQQRIRRLEDENDAMLHHLHQVQEELEHRLLLAEAYERKVSELSQQYDATRASQVDSPNLLNRLTDLLGHTQYGRIHAIKSSGLFDEIWYQQQYPDVAEKVKGIDLARHYLEFGAREGRNPGPQFDTHWYLSSYPDVAAKGINPLLHYVQNGKNEGRQPCAERARPADPIALERQWLQQTRDEQAQLAAQRQRQLEALQQAHSMLEQEKTALVGRCDQLEQAVAALTQARDEQIGLAEERQAQIATLAQARDEQAQVAAELRSELEALKQEQVALEQEKSMLAGRRDQLEQAVAALTQARDDQIGLAEERQAQIATLAKRLAETQQRAAQLDAELDQYRQLAEQERSRVENSFKAIKEILLSEAG